MNVTEEEKSKAHLLLKKCKEHEQKKNLISVKIGKGITIMMPPNYTETQLEAKRKKYLDK